MAAAGFGGWIWSLSPEVTAVTTPVPLDETAATIEALRPPLRDRPVIAVIGLNDATETLDYIMAAGILRRADVADVRLLAIHEGPVSLYPALRVEPDGTAAAFDAEFVEGADYVIVPAMSRDDDPDVLAWIQAQAGKGSIIIGVCAGAKVVAAAGLLQDRRATTHWFHRNDLLKKHPSITYVADRRFVVDGKVATTTGITAAMPLALTLIEAIAGPEKAAGVAADIGVTHWDARHDSAAFQLNRPFVTSVLANTIAFWKREEVRVALPNSFDAVSLALAADAWSRTYRSSTVTLAATGAAVADRYGIKILPDVVAANIGDSQSIQAFGAAPPAVALESALAAIESRYGEATMKVVTMQLEYTGGAL